jgi:hypothetical protein
MFDRAKDPSLLRDADVMWPQQGGRVGRQGQRATGLA